MMKLLLRLALLIFIGIIVYLIYLLAPTSLSGEKFRFVVPLESKQEEAIARLKEQNFIRSQGTFNFFIGFIHFPGTIEPGAYLLSHRMSIWQIADTVLNHPYQKWIVLVPGLRKEQVAERLAKKFSWDGNQSKDFLDNASEGYLAPDTYLLNIDFSPKEMAQRLTSNFNEKFDEKLQKDLLSQNERTDTAIKVASLIERESGSDSDKALIAGIIWNRLNVKMPLQIDATIQYALGTPADWWPRVQPKDLKLDSDYNTYLIRGLPPGPIANPSLASIKAAVYPAETDCLFYLHDHNKQIHCSKTYGEHLENIDKYLN